ncbi:hypothetical protein fugu_000761 [Takifugu bimaculatus]|uniref:C-type lectin domain-containing protein n=1 Tax=Takifugu bimaculatus TaxID=433685 RepID=A0A4Z2CHN2_9TELE|nr:hypothetical protein fugu_000761 [Takifugu bimaculatus]
MDPAAKCHTRLFLLGPKSAGVGRYLAVYVLFYLVLITHASPAKPCDKNCLSGKCINGSCICDRGWVGDQCQHCQGRFKLTEPSGYLTDGPISYKYKTKCTWLIEGYPNAVLRLRFNHFATECSWDHMYIYDGDSIYAPLVAVFRINSCPNNCSGHGKCAPGNSAASRVYCECDKYWKGEACDIPYCRNNCGSPDHGYCDLTGEKLCVCNDSWQGPDCSLTVPSTESFWILPSVKPFGTSLARASHKVVVQDKVMWVVGGYTFNYSSFQMILNYNLESGVWNTVPINSGLVPRYGHSLAAYQDEIYMFGGKLEGGRGNVTDELWVFNVPSRTWQRRNPVVVQPAQIYAVEGHSAHCIQTEGGDAIMLLIFGYSPIYSYISNVQEYNLTRMTASSGSLYVHGGYKALPANKYGLVDDLYRYNVNSRTWFILKESGFPRYLHSAVLLSGTLLIFGGNTHNDTSLSNGAKCFSADFLAYDIACDEWRLLPRPDLHRDVNRFGHSAVVSNGSMYVFGGFSGMLLNDVLVYRPPSCQAFVAEESCVLAGPGMRCIWSRGRCLSWEPSMANGSLIPDSFCPTKPATVDERCYRFSDCASCTANTNGCQWCDDKKCISASSNCSSSVKNFPECPVRNEQLCTKLANCKSCSLNLNCQWDQNQSQCHALPAQQCSEGWSQVGEACLRINSSRESYDNAQHYCKNLNGNIASLTTPKQVDFVLEELKKLQQQDKRLSPWVGLRKINVSYWGWEDMTPFTNSSLRWLPGEPSDSGFCAYLEEPQVTGLRANPCTATAHGLICEKATGNPSQSSRPSCKKPCSLHSNCANCTSQGMECMWCSSAQRCVDSTAYVISFPYGQCLEWQTGDCVAQNCSGLRTCSQCLEQPECGWCGDPSSTGKGLCMEGSYRGPMKRPAKQGQPVQAHHQPQDMSLELNSCPREKGFEWAFIQCPACQCNGHSTCVNSSVCEQCRNLTTGPNCQTCMPGYHGDPTNGGKCQAYVKGTGKVRGTCASDRPCEFLRVCAQAQRKARVCDSENRYLGNPLRGTCYYNLLIDYQFTFSLIQEDDNHYTAINFMASPEQASKNLDMSINASNNFNLNITWSVGSTAGTISGEEVPIVSKTNIKEYKDSFSCEKFTFRSNPNITFYVYVSNFSWPIKIQIAFSQHNNIMDLVQFFVTFFSCFLSLLLVAAVVWKIKQTCWASRRRELSKGDKNWTPSRGLKDEKTTAVNATKEDKG